MTASRLRQTSVEREYVSGPGSQGWLCCPGPADRRLAQAGVDRLPCVSAFLPFRISSDVSPRNQTYHCAEPHRHGSLLVSRSPGDAHACCPSDSLRRLKSTKPNMEALQFNVSTNSNEWRSLSSSSSRGAKLARRAASSSKQCDANSRHRWTTATSRASFAVTGGRSSPRTTTTT